MEKFLSLTLTQKLIWPAKILPESKSGYRPAAADKASEKYIKVPAILLALW